VGVFDGACVGPVDAVGTFVGEFEGAVVGALVGLFVCFSFVDLPVLYIDAICVSPITPE
jgi:hypothetical protein